MVNNHYFRPGFAVFHCSGFYAILVGGFRVADFLFTFALMLQWEEQIDRLLDSALHRLSDIEPDEWAEQNMVIKEGNFQGPLSYDLNPYFREIIRCLSPYHPATEVALMGPAQIGKSKALIEPFIAFLIAEHPCIILYLTGHTTLSEESMMKLDSAIDNAGLRPLIFKQTLSKKNTQTGDTKMRKEFPGGSLTSGSATNHNLLRQRDPKVVIADDIEAANNAAAKTGSTVALIRKRTNSYGRRKKILWVTTAQLKEGSIILPLIEQGDERVYEIPCQCCGAMIELKWERFEWGWENGEFVPGSVVYRCQECNDVFDDSNKREFMMAGKWRPTRKPSNPTYVSFRLRGWYAGVGMDDWEAIVREYLTACPPGGAVDKRLLQAWTNLTKGDVYEDETEELKAGVLQRQAYYDIGVIPEKTSVAQGNGRIVLITCGADMNGILENGRLDYEVVAWAENGSSYSICHGSIGTFKPAILKTKKEKENPGLTEWYTYEENKPLSIWPPFEEVLRQEFPVEVCEGDKPRKMAIGLTMLDVGHLKEHALTFINKALGRGLFVQGIKGRGDEEFAAFVKEAQIVELEKRIYSKAPENENFWVAKVGYIKDQVSSEMNLKWDATSETQPSGYMNFPHPGQGQYEWPNYFSHYESEKRVLVANKKESNVTVHWEKVSSNSQNHIWDCRVYNKAGKDIWIMILKEKYGTKGVEITWATYCSMTLKLRAQN